MIVLRGASKKLVRASNADTDRNTDTSALRLDNMHTSTIWPHSFLSKKEVVLLGLCGLHLPNGFLGLQGLLGVTRVMRVTRVTRVMRVIRVIRVVKVVSYVDRRNDLVRFFHFHSKMTQN